MTDEEIGRAAVDAAVQVHGEIGSGLLERVYEVVIATELRERGLMVERQVPVPLVHRGVRFDEGFRMDLLVEARVVIELKCIDHLNNAHRKQLLTYLRLAGLKLGYLLNFAEPLMKDGIVRIVNGAGNFRS